MKILLFEPRFEGHHVPWASLLARSLLDADAEVILAHGSDPRQLDRLEFSDPGLVNRLQLHPACPEGGFEGGAALASLDAAAQRHRPDRILVANLDEFAASLFRKAALGGRLPASLHGQLRGIYIRPRPLDLNQRGFQNAWKRKGYARLATSGAFARLGILDEDLAATVASTPGHPPITWMPDFWTPSPPVDRSTARRAFKVPDGRTAFLFFGVPHRRKGLELLVDAMSRSGHPDRFLLVAGDQHAGSPELKQDLDRLVRDGRAVVHDRFLDDAEMAAAYVAADRVVLPYRSHYGSSGVLGHAALHARPVVASDFHLLGRRVVRANLGLVHANEDAASLAETMDRSIEASDDVVANWQKSLQDWRDRNAPEAFAHAARSLAGI